MGGRCLLRPLLCWMLFSGCGQPSSLPSPAVARPTGESTSRWEDPWWYMYEIEWWAHRGGHDGLCGVLRLSEPEVSGPGEAVSGTQWGEETDNSEACGMVDTWCKDVVLPPAVVARIQTCGWDIVNRALVSEGLLALARRCMVICQVAWQIPRCENLAMYVAGQRATLRCLLKRLARQSEIVPDWLTMNDLWSTSGVRAETLNDPFLSPQSWMWLQSAKAILTHGRDERQHPKLGPDEEMLCCQVVP